MSKALQPVQCQNTEPNLCPEGAHGLSVKEINVLTDNY